MPKRKTYPVYQSPSGWNEILDQSEGMAQNDDSDQRPNLQNDYDFTIIGAGFTGLAIARQLAYHYPESAILVLDATSIAEGSSGRNSGFLISLPHNTKMSGHGSNIGLASKQIRIYQNAVNWLEKIVKKNAIACEWSNIGKYHGAATSTGTASLRRAVQEYEMLEIPHRVIPADEIAQRIGTTYYNYAIWTAHNVLVQPAALVRGLIDSLPANVTVAFNTIVRSIDGQDPYTVTTSRGSLKSKTVILANNGFARALGYLKDRLITIYTYAAMTPEPADALSAQHGTDEQWGLIPANRLGTTLRKTKSGRLLVRSSYSYERPKSLQDVQKLLQNAYARRYPDLESHAFEYIWGGATALTRNGAMYFGQLQPGLYACLGCNGAGVLKGTAYGRLLADYIAGAQSQDLTDVLSFDSPGWLPPEPFRCIGVLSAIQYQKIKAGGER